MPAARAGAGEGYVAGAYLAFVALLLIYVAIMAGKLQRIQRAAARAGRRATESGAEEERMSGLLALGVSHRTAPLELRERLALTEGRAAGVLSGLVGEEPITEAAAISTCNRTELYLVAADTVEAETAALGVLAREAVDPPDRAARPALLAARHATRPRHLFAVTAGLDSMIIGEAEIQGQVKRAYELALVEGATGAVLNRLFRGALAAGKRARTETAIGEKGVSIPSVAVELAQRNLGDLARPPRAAGRRRRDLGADARGPWPRAASRPCSSPTAATTARSGWPQRFGGTAVRIDELPAQLERADIVVSATDSPHHLIERSELEQ